MLTPKQVAKEVRRYKEPNSIVFSLTSKCPLACKYCYVKDIYKDLNAAYIKQCVYELENVLSPVCFNFFGGEPGVKCDVIDEVMSFINQNVPCTIITSGINLDGVKRLSEKYKNFYIILSFDGPYNNQRMLKNGKQFDLSKIEIPDLKKVTVRTTISTDFDYRNIPYVLNWCSKHNFDWSYGWQEGIDKEDTIDWVNLESVLFDIIKNLDLCENGYKLPIELMRGIIEEYSPKDPKDRLGCDFGHNLIINSQGVFPCVGSQYAMNEVEDVYPEQCYNCDVYSCHGQCLANNRKKNIKFNELHCKFYKKVSTLYKNIIKKYIELYSEDDLKKMIAIHKLYYREKCISVDHSNQYILNKGDF